MLYRITDTDHELHDAACPKSLLLNEDVERRAIDELHSEVGQRTVRALVGPRFIDPGNARMAE